MIFSFYCKLNFKAPDLKLVRVRVALKEKEAGAATKV